MRPLDVVERLTNCTALVEQLCRISGVLGLSVGVLHENEVVFRENLGRRDAAGTLPTTSDTIYSTGSLTKAFTASALAILLDGRPDLGWDTSIDEFLPGLRPKNIALGGHISVGDLMAHRSGLFGDMSMAVQGNDDFLLGPKDLMASFSNLMQVAPPRRNWMYNNWGYSVAGAIIEKLSGKSFGKYLDEVVLQPLNLSRTTTKPSVGPDNDLAEPTSALPDGAFWARPRSFIFEDSIFEPAGGICSSVNDLLSWTKAVLHAEAHPEASPLKDVATLISNQIPLDNPSRDFRFYGMGWIRTQLPGVVGLQGENSELFSREELPIIGRGFSMVTYYHQSCAPGFNGAVYLFPETRSSVVVLTNSMALNDASDWVAQAIVSALFNFTDAVDYVDLAQRSRDRNLANFEAMMGTIDRIRKEHAEEKMPRPRRDYVGRYCHSSVDFHLDISAPEDSAQDDDGTLLRMRFQSRETQTYPLRHLYGDVFEWAMPFEEQARTLMFPVSLPEYFQVRFNFSANGAGTPAHLDWAVIDDAYPGKASGIHLERRGCPGGTPPSRGFMSRIQKLLGYYQD